MAFTRKNVWELGDPWADPILWYARGVKALKARPFTDRTSWKFHAAIHGIHQQFWEVQGYLQPGEAQPSDDDKRTFWDQCQHGTWYFLPWHRGYLLGFEAVVRAAITDLHGPQDWALPYWNYFKNGQSDLPPAFASRDWPDGNGDNPLFVPQRYGPQWDGNVFIPLDPDVELKPLGDPDFTGPGGGGSAGFGGVDTGFEHGGDTHGGIESHPHDVIHGTIGGRDPQTRLPGLMSVPPAAALDPIFWLHHANIDRLWQVWLENPTTHLDPTESKWLKGPASFGERAFVVPLPNHATLTYTPEQMSDLSSLGYSYDDLAPQGAPVDLRSRLERLGAPAAAVRALTLKRGATVSKDDKVELVGSNRKATTISGAEARTRVELDSQARAKVSNRLAMVEGEAPPDRFFLNLQGVRGDADGAAFRVYIGDRLAGTVGLFGVRQATEEGARTGLNFSLEITDIVDELHLQNALSADQLDVRFVPLRPIPEETKIDVGRVSVFRQGK